MFLEKVTGIFFFVHSFNKYFINYLKFIKSMLGISNKKTLVISLMYFESNWLKM